MPNKVRTSNMIINIIVLIIRQPYPHTHKEQEKIKALLSTSKD